ncbi:unnamed protein product [Calypogeia fissa]
MTPTRSIYPVRDPASGIVVSGDRFLSSSPSSFRFLSGIIRLGSRNITRLASFPPIDYTRSLIRSPLPPARISRSQEVIAAMRTSSASYLRNKSAPWGSTKEDFVDVEDPVSVSSGALEYRGKQNQLRLGVDEESQLHSAEQDSNMNARHMKVDILTIKDEVASLSPSPMLRVKSGNRLGRVSSEGSHEEKQPLVRAQPQARRAFTEQAGFAPPKRHHSFRDDVGHAAAETFLLTRLTIRLLRYLGVGYRWITRFLALSLYAIFLMPGFLQVGFQYFFSKNIHRSIVYGDQPRNRLDLYTPDDLSSPKPVVIFVTGGAWIIGYKAWGALLGIQLSERDIMVCCVDYRNFPQGGISDMVEDVSTGIGFIVNNIDQFGGDPNRIYLAGQSAGSHIASCALVEQARIEIGQKEGVATWTTKQIKAFIGLSGGYNLPKLVDHFHGRGLYRSIFLSVMEGETSLPLYSPELAVQSEAFAPAVPLLPPIYLFHGTADYSIPYEASENFASALRRVGATVMTKLYADKTHTDVFLQDPMRGGYDLLFDDLLAILHADDVEARARDAKAPLRPRLVPEILLYLAHIVSPF